MVNMIDLHTKYDIGLPCCLQVARYHHHDYKCYNYQRNQSDKVSMDTVCDAH